MATLASILPKPKHQAASSEVPAKESPSQVVAAPRNDPPPYGTRRGFVPRTDDDFGDGGAFPEIHIAQYPRGMGRKRETSLIPNTVPVQYDAQGQMRYDVLAKVGHSQDRRVQTSLSDMLPKDVAEETEFARPSAEEMQRQMQATRAALEKKLSGKINATQPKNITALSTGSDKETLIRYTPSGQANEGHNSGAQSRLIRMVEVQKDPLDPPKFNHKRIPKPPPSPPAPVLHSPPRKVTAEEQVAWKIPPCISNWKNPKGYTIPLDKRLAADGRGLQELTINERFASVAEALYLSERHSREEVEKRAAVEKKLAEQERRQKEESLRILAQQARQDNVAISRAIREAAEREGTDGSRDPSVISSDKAGLSLQEREKIRRDREYERERELRMSRMNPEQRNKILAREEQRDISEKIALGVAQPPVSSESLYDQRLFDQTQGIGTGLHDDEVYNLYDKPLFAGSSAHLIYKPTLGGNDKDMYGAEDSASKLLSTDRFKPDQAFKGADASQTRSGPVEFEKSSVQDPFGLEQFLSEAKKGKRGHDDKDDRPSSSRTRDSENDKRSRRR